MQWRKGRLRRAGFAPGLAEVLAHRERVDLHELLKLVDHGCPPHLAARILAPLDEPLAPDGPLPPDEPFASGEPGRIGRHGW